jgi:hypothetical protein
MSHRLHRRYGRADAAPAATSTAAKKVDRQKLGNMMAPWGKNGDNGIYPVGSYYFADKVYPNKANVEKALKDIEALTGKSAFELTSLGHSAKDVETLKAIAGGLKYFLQNDYAGAK